MLLVANDSGDQVQFSWSQVMGDHSLTVQVHLGGADDLLSNDQLSADPPAWLGVRVDEGVMHLETSADGITWLPHYSMPIPFDVDEIEVGFAASNWQPLFGEAEVAVTQVELLCGS